MKRFIILCLLLVCSTASSWSQGEERQYLFPEFQTGRVVYKDGRIFYVQINYYLITNRFVFIDTYDENEMKELGEITQLDSITIGGRVFTVTRRGEASEKVQYENPVIFVEYTGKSKDRGQRSTYGGRSQIASIKSVSQIRSYGNTYSGRR